MIETDAQLKAALLNQCDRLRENCRYTATTHLVQAKWLGYVHFFILGPIPLVLGSLGGWKGFNAESQSLPRQWVVWASLCSLIGGIVGTLLTFWNLSDARIRHKAAGNLYKSLEHDAVVAREVHALADSVSEFKDRVVKLGDRYNQLNESSIETSDWAFSLAQRKVGSGVFTTAADRKSKRAS